MIKIQITKFLIVGCISTILNYSLFFIMLKLFQINYILSFTFGFVAGLLLGYIINKQWTFKAKSTRHVILFAYATVYLISLFVGILFLRFLTERLFIPPEISNVFTIGLTTCTNFIGLKFFVFKGIQ